MAYTDERIEDDDDDYVVPTSTRVDDNDRVQSSSSLRTTDGLTISVVKGSITSQKVHLSGPGVGHLN